MNQQLSGMLGDTVMDITTQFNDGNIKAAIAKLKDLTPTQSAFVAVSVRESLERLHGKDVAWKFRAALLGSL